LYIISTYQVHPPAHFVGGGFGVWN